MSKSFYCYTHATPDGEVFYVGKGHGKRAWEFNRRNDDHKLIVAIHGSENIRIDVLPADSELDALQMERFLITVVFGRNGLTNKTCGGEGIKKGQSNLEKQTAWIERQRNGTGGYGLMRKITVWVPIATFERFTSLAKAEGRTRTFIRLVERAQP